MKIGDATLPDKCPDKCPGHDGYPGQGGMCARCPLFNCLPVKESDGTEFRLVEPEDFDKECAKAWQLWFDSGMKDTHNPRR